MDLKEELLKEIIAEYYEVEKKKHYIENKTAYVIVNAKFIESLRHAVSHLMAGLQLNFDNAPEDDILKQYNSAKKHIGDIDVGGYEYLSGLLLTQLREKIEVVNYFNEKGNSEKLRLDAVRYFGMGRDSRTMDKKRALECFEKCIDLCQNGLNEIKPLERKEIATFKINLFNGVFAAIALVVAIFAYFK